MNAHVLEARPSAVDFGGFGLIGVLVYDGVSHMMWRLERNGVAVGTLNWREQGGPQMVTKSWTAWTPETGRHSRHIRDAALAAVTATEMAA